MRDEKIKELAGKAGEQNGCLVYDIFKHKDKIQIFIDKEKEQVNLKDCENVFHSLQFLLQTELPALLEQKRLEISSPGLDKKLRETWHFKKALGETIKLTTTCPVPAKSKKTGRIFSCGSFTGNLEKVLKEDIEISNSQLETKIPFSKIKSARVCPLDNFQKLKKNKKSEVR